MGDKGFQVMISGIRSLFSWRDWWRYEKFKIDVKYIKKKKKEKKIEIHLYTKIGSREMDPDINTIRRVTIKKLKNNILFIF